MYIYIWKGFSLTMIQRDEQLGKLFSLSLSSSSLNFSEPPTVLPFAPFYSPPPPLIVLPFSWISRRYLSHQHFSCHF